MALGNAYVPAVRTIGMVGVNPFAQQLQQFGIRLDRLLATTTATAWRSAARKSACWN